MQDGNRAPVENELPIFIVSGGTGASGEQLLHTVLVQFPRTQVRIHKVPGVKESAQIEEVVMMAESSGGIIVHTLLDAGLRGELMRSGHDKGVATVDLMGTLVSTLAESLSQDPINEPGLYHKMHRAYFERVEAIEFSIAHDDGQNLRDLHKSEIVLLGVSRAGKTPLSMYLAMHGWKVANIPLVMGISAPQELKSVDRRRIIGLRIDYEQLRLHRQKRQSGLGVKGPSFYTEPASIFDEIEEVRKIYRRGRYATINVTNKPIESSADEIVHLITNRFRNGAHLE